MSAALEKVAKEVGTEHISAVAIAYVLQKTPYVFPIIGGRKVEHLNQNIEALKISLSQEQIEYLENVVPFDPGFPTWMIVSSCFSSLYRQLMCRLQGDGSKPSRFLSIAAHEDQWPLKQAIRPSDSK